MLRVLKTVLIATFLLQVCALMCRTISPDEAATFYSEGKFRQAVEAYESILKDGIRNSDIHFNLGNAYFKAGEYGLAMLNYERAYVLRPGDEDIRHNIQVVAARLKDRVEAIPLLAIVEWWNTVKREHDLETIFLWSVIWLWLCAIAAYFFFASRSILLRRVALMAGVLLFAVFTSTVFLLMDKQEDLQARRYAIVLAKAVTARSTPDAAGVDAFTIHEGLKVEILENSGDACHIRLADGKEGWIDCAAVERI